MPGMRSCSPVFQVSGRVGEVAVAAHGRADRSVITGATGVFVIPAVPGYRRWAFVATSWWRPWGCRSPLSTLALAAGLALHDGWHDDAWRYCRRWRCCRALLGMWLGKRIRSRLSPQRFRQGFLLFLLALGIELIARDGWSESSSGG